MKKLYKYLSAAALSGMVCVGLTPSANAQHNRGGGGGGGGRSGGGATVSRPAPSNSGGYSGHSDVSPSRPAPSPSRPSVSSNNNSRPQPAARVVGSQRLFGSRQNNPGQRSVGVVPRGPYSGHNIGAPRTGVTAQRYRTYQGSVYGRNHPGSPYNRNYGYLPGRTGYHYNRGYYGSYYYPRLGFSVGFLPYGYYPFYFGDYQYYYSDGLFYQYNDDQYTVVEPPVGAEVTTLPSNAQSIVINGQQYYEVNGVYYEPITKDDGTLSYQVAGKDGELNTNEGGDDQSVDNAPPAPQIGDIVPELPPNCRKISINGEKLYLSPDGVYFKAQLDQDNNKVYKIVGLPADDDQSQPDQSGN